MVGSAIIICSMGGLLLSGVPVPGVNAQRNTWTAVFMSIGMYRYIVEVTWRYCVGFPSASKLILGRCPKLSIGGFKNERNVCIIVNEV